MAKKGWFFSPKKQAKPKVPESQKLLTQQKCNEFIESELKPKYLQSPPTDNPWNYRVDIFGKWYRNYFYFCSTFNCPGPNALSPSFESKFARLEYVAFDRFNIAYMRHTGQWWPIEQNLSLEECLSEMRNNPILQP